VEVKESKNLKTGKKIVSTALLFPHGHQLDAVTALLDATLSEGPGHNYLIMHSAGSGKSNTIGWLSHRLSSLHTKANVQQGLNIEIR